MTLTLDYKKNRNGMCLMNGRKKKVKENGKREKLHSMVILTTNLPE